VPVKPAIDYDITYDKPGRRLLIATTCGRVQTEWPYPYKRPPTIQDALWALAALHCGICHQAGVPYVNTEIGAITFNGAVVPPAGQRSGDSEQPAREPGLQSQTDQPQIPPALS
jgi:hypothetical protein